MKEAQSLIRLGTTSWLHESENWNGLNVFRIETKLLLLMKVSPYLFQGRYIWDSFSRLSKMTRTRPALFAIEKFLNQKNWQI